MPRIMEYYNRMVVKFPSVVAQARYMKPLVSFKMLTRD